MEERKRVNRRTCIKGIDLVSGVYVSKRKGAKQREMGKTSLSN